LLDPPSLKRRLASSNADLSGIPITQIQLDISIQCEEVARDLHNKHRSSQLDSLFPPLQEQVILFPLAVHVAVCSVAEQNSLQSSSSSFSQADLEDKNEAV
jgi:hypothetical protein